MKRSCVVLLLACAALWLLVSLREIVGIALTPPLPGEDVPPPDIQCRAGVWAGVTEAEIRDMAYRHYQAEAAKLTH